MSTQLLTKRRQADLHSPPVGGLPGLQKPNLDKVMSRRVRLAACARRRVRRNDVLPTFPPPQAAQKFPSPFA